MKTIYFITSFLTFYLKGEIKSEKNFIKFKIPNTILNFIPLGVHKKSIAINQITSVDTDSRLLFKNLVLGIVILFIGFATIASFIGIIFLLLGILICLNSFQTILQLNLTSGSTLYIPFVIFEKKKASEAEEAINVLINERLDSTNTKEQTDRLVDAIENKE